MTKRILSFLLILSVLCVTLAGVAPVAHAAEVLQSGKAGENITWTTYDDGRLVFSGTGRMDDGEDWLVKNWYRYDPVDVIFEEGITYIGAYSFYNSASFDSIKTVTIPSTLTETGAHAFSGLYNLERVYITDLEAWCAMDLTKNYCSPLDEGADLYLNGEKVVDLVIPETITRLNDKVFWGCESLRSVTVPAHVTEIGHNAFTHCTNLEEIYFKGNPPTFGTKVFYGCDVKAYYPPNNSAWNQDVFSLNSEGVTWLRDQQAPFSDVPKGSWYYDSVNWALEEGITTGMSDTTFEPNSICTRAQIITFLWRAAGKPEPMLTVNPFVDVKSSDYFYKAVLWALETDRTTGVTDTTFEPNSVCTRAQIVTFLHRSAGTPDPTTGNNPFVDVPSGEYYHQAVLWAVENGITTGMTATTFEPGTQCTRAQAVTFLHRYCLQPEQ